MNKAVEWTLFKERLVTIYKDKINAMIFGISE